MLNFTVSFDKALAPVPISVIVFAALVPKKLAGIALVPGGKFITTLPRFVFGAILLKTAWICARLIPAGQVMVPPAHVQGDKRVLSMQLASLGLIIFMVA